jgi:hypothetical protein
MKKIIFILVAMCLGVVSCKKHNEDVEVTAPMVTISFEQKLVTSNSMVRSTTNEFLDIIEEQTPKYVNVTLINTDLNKTFTCKSNETITIPIGNYEISAKCNTPTNEYVVGTSGLMYKTPIIKCNSFTHFISNTTQVVTLNCFYNCYAVFALIDECKSCVAYYIDKDVDFYKKGKYHIAYFNYNESRGMNVRLTPYDDSNEFITTTYTFSTTYDINKVFAEFGKYYVIHPQKVDKTTSSFDLALENMTEGEI